MLGFQGPRTERSVSEGRSQYTRRDETVVLGKSGLHTVVIVTASELVNAVVSDLPPDVRSIVGQHFQDGDSVFKIQRQRGMKRRDVEARIETALGAMRRALRSRGVKTVRM